VATGESWAVKIMEKKTIKSKKFVNRYLKEIYMLKHLDHPNIIRIYEYFEDDERIYIIMELCRG